MIRDTDQFGRLLVFEGADGVGKTTLAHELVRKLNAIGVPSLYVSFPGREQGGLGKLVYDLHHGQVSSDLQSLHPISRQLLHVASHIDLITRVIRPALEHGTWVILDRYWWSTWVYGKLSDASESALNLMVQIEREHWTPIKPDAIFLITRTPQPGAAPLPFDNDLNCAYEQFALQQAEVRVVWVDTQSKSQSESLDQVLNDLRDSRLFPVAMKTTSRDRDKQNGMGSVFSKLASPRFSPVMDTYWHFAAERQKVFFARLRGQSPPWTDDRILQKHKFTNAYRASDRVSQFLIRNVIYGDCKDESDIVFRTLLFKLFNKIETWELLQTELGELHFRGFSADKYAKILDMALDRKERIYSAAYIMPSGKQEQRKHRFHLELLQRMIAEQLPVRLAECRDLQSVYERLLAYPSVGPFLAFQFAIDLNYSPLVNFSEMDFVVPGPGARDGIRKCIMSLGEYSEADLIRLVADQQLSSFERLGINFMNLWGRPLQLIDCQNLFCEVDKYSRVAHPEYSGVTGRTRIKQVFRAKASPISYWYPPKWGINERLSSEQASR